MALEIMNNKRHDAFLQRMPDQPTEEECITLNTPLENMRLDLNDLNGINWMIIRIFSSLQFKANRSNTESGWTCFIN